MSYEEITIVVDQPSSISVTVNADAPVISVSEPQSTRQAVTVTASEAIGGHRGVAINTLGLAVYADLSNTPDCIGISTGAAEEGSPLVVQITGYMTESSWSWTPGEAVFLGETGLLTQTPPTTGGLVVIGTATGVTQLLINIEQPIKL